MHRLYFLLTLVMVYAFPFSPFSQITSPGKNIKNIQYHLISADEVNDFYRAGGNKLFWLNEGEQSHLLRIALLQAIDSAEYAGLDKNKYRLAELNENIHKSFLEEDSVMAIKVDRILTDAAISYSKDLYRGYKIGNWVSYDELSKKTNEEDNAYLINRLLLSKTAPELKEYFHSLEPNCIEYASIKIELSNQLKAKNTLKKIQLITSLNLYRWIRHFHFDKYIVVNIGSATLRYYECDSLVLRMKAVVGKPSTKTPRFAAHCNQVIIYPYWNVPASIALKELLPKFKRDPNEIDYLNMQILDAKDNVINHHKLNWKLTAQIIFPLRSGSQPGVIIPWEL